MKISNFIEGKGTAWFILIVSLAATLWSWQLAKVGAERLARERFEFVTKDIQSAINDRISAYEQILQSAAALFAVTTPVTREDWRTYLSRLDISSGYPGVFGIGFALRVLPDELKKHIEHVRGEGFPEYTVWPEGQRDEYAPVVYLESFDERNRPTFGYDMFSDPVRRTAMERCRETGEPTVSGKINLVEETGKALQTGFLMCLPVYMPDAAEQRRAALTGYIFGEFRMNDFMQGIVARRRPGIILQIYDGTDISEASRMYGSNPSRSRATESVSFTSTTAIDIKGRPWILVVSALPAFQGSLNRLTPLIVLLMLVSISVLLFAMTWSLATTRERAFALATRMTSAIKESETRLREITSTLGEGVFVQDRNGRITFINPEAEKLLGWSEQELLGQEAHRLIHHCDGARASVSLAGGKCAMADAILTGQRFRADEETFWRKDGKVLPVSVIASPILRDGEPAAAVVAFRDISERKQTESALRDSHRFRSLFEHARDALFLIEASGRILDVNRLACESLTYPRESLIGTSFDEFVRNLTIGDQDASFLRILEQVHIERSVLVEAEYLRRDGSRFPGEAMLSLIDYEGKRLILVAVRDIMERKQAGQQLKRVMMELERAKSEAENLNRRLAMTNLQLQRISQIDGLTGIANRRYFDQYLATEWRRAARSARSISLIFADVDYFKSYNDHYGHQAGDECLTKVARALQTLIHRPADLLARYGGEEFVVVLPETGPGGAYHIAERMREAVAALDIPHAKSETASRVTLSLGVATAKPREEPILEHLIEAADRALYRAKAEGRNAVRLDEVGF